MPNDYKARVFTENFYLCSTTTPRRSLVQDTRPKLNKKMIETCLFLVTFMMVHSSLTILYVFKLRQNSGKAGFGFT